jgi:NAD-dependent deacetylase
VQVIELHGNGSYATCLECGLRHELEVLKQSFTGRGEIPACRDCGGIVKTATISFGQALAPATIEQAREETLACDLFIVLGSSLVVYPAAGFPQIAKENGARLVIVNREETGLDRIADLVLHEPIGDTLGEAAGVN